MNVAGPDLQDVRAVISAGGSSGRKVRATAAYETVDKGQMLQDYGNGTESLDEAVS